ncbi:hypothetical protein [Lentilactobacillus buchneri]|uniref:hypothetical protein n=1 Tax=Lentilactobacillus buchneri TaxID=1581 RepID=UPI0002F2A06B|nr:hypothetical protein [Lentilactobacillus buchneri]MCT2901796.1 hypothetical protein [Lentilactobacillus buchneri]
MFEYEDENGQQAILLSKVSFVTKTTGNTFAIYFAGDSRDKVDVPLEQYTKFMNMLKAWAMKH